MTVGDSLSTLYEVPRQINARWRREERKRGETLAETQVPDA
jgi:hypothetical protein